MAVSRVGCSVEVGTWFEPLCIATTENTIDHIVGVNSSLLLRFVMYFVKHGLIYWGRFGRITCGRFAQIHISRTRLHLAGKDWRWKYISYVSVAHLQCRARLLTTVAVWRNLLRDQRIFSLCDSRIDCTADSLVAAIQVSDVKLGLIIMFELWLRTGTII